MALAVAPHDIPKEDTGAMVWFSLATVYFNQFRQYVDDQTWAEPASLMTVPS